jgi:hypothetical protein
MEAAFFLCGVWCLVIAFIFLGGGDWREGVLLVATGVTLMCIGIGVRGLSRDTATVDPGVGERAPVTAGVDAGPTGGDGEYDCFRPPAIL